MIHDRHMGLFVVPDSFEVAVIGVGGIGAVTALCLAKMGVKYMSLYDFDEVGPENLATQLLSVSGVGKLKVDDVQETLARFSDEINVLPLVTKVDSQTDLTGDLIVCAVDTIEARKEVFGAVLNGSHTRWFLDTRMSAMEYQHFLVDLEHERAWNAYADMLDALDDTNVPDAPCTMKSTFFTAMMAAAHAGNILKEIVTGEAISHRLVHNMKTNFLVKLPL
jgi:threonine dehydrogenase-like Zn-dependent dehydrogenase